VLQAEAGVVGLEWYPCCRLKPVWLGWSGIRVAS